MSVRVSVAVMMLWAGWALACAPAGPVPFSPDPDAPAADADAGLATAPVEVTLLYTADEHGWVLPFESAGLRQGGAAQLLTQLVTEEDHCAGELPREPETPNPPAFLIAAGAGGPSSSPPAAASEGAEPAGAREAPGPGHPDRCASASTLLLSGGDNYAGPAVSGYFRGATMAAAMARLGYAASAFGNHEFDYGRAAYVQNRRRAAVQYVAANLVAADGGAQDVVLPYATIERAGLHIGVVGLATEETLRAAMASRFVGLRLEDAEAALARTIPRVWQSGVDAVVLLAHECADPMLRIVERHPEWHLSFVGLGHCHKAAMHTVGGTVVAAPGWRLDHYARVRLRVHRGTSGPRRAEVISHDLVPVAMDPQQPALSVDAEFDQRIADWKATVDAALGAVIGHSATGLAQDSPALGHWVVRSWRERLGVDVAITTRGAIRQELLPGPIRLATVYSILPFENALVVARIPGSALVAMLKQPRSIFAGVVVGADGALRRPSGKSLEPERIYRVATTDYLYFGGDGYPFEQLDPAPEMTGVDWRAPVIEWTREQKTTAMRPLEAVLAHR